MLASKTFSRFLQAGNVFCFHPSWFWRSLFWRFVCKTFWEFLKFHLGKHPGVELLGHREIAFNFRKNCQTCSKRWYHFSLPPGLHLGLTWQVLWISATLDNVCVFLTISDARHLCMCFWPPVCLLGRNVYFDTLPIFKLGCLLLFF